MKEIVCGGKTVEEAVRLGAAKLGVPEESVNVEVLVQPRRGILGIGAVEAQVRVSYDRDGGSVAYEFVKTVLDNMGIRAEITVTENTGDDGDETRISVTGEETGALIGYHGETLDALQYLAGLAANKKENDEDPREYKKIVVDVENYRAKREEALRTLAKRMAAKVLRGKRNITLEPMSPYERRIIHSEVQNIEGVTTESIGEGDSRRVVIHLEGKPLGEHRVGSAANDAGAEGGKKRRRRRRGHAGEATDEDGENEPTGETAPEKELSENPEDYFEIVDASVYLNEEDK